MTVIVHHLLNEKDPHLGLKYDVILFSLDNDARCSSSPFKICCNMVMSTSR